MSIETWIVCNCCNGRANVQSHERPHQVRAELKENGWHVSLPGGKDYCPRCWEALKREEGKTR